MYDMYPASWIERIADQQDAVVPKRRPRRERDLTPPSLRRIKQSQTVTSAA